MWKTKKYTWLYTSPCLKTCAKTKTDFHCHFAKVFDCIDRFIPLVHHRRSLARSVACLPLLASKRSHRPRSKTTKNAIQ